MISFLLSVQIAFLKKKSNKNISFLRSKLRRCWTKREEKVCFVWILLAQQAHISTGLEIKLKYLLNIYYIEILAQQAHIFPGFLEIKYYIMLHPLAWIILCLEILYWAPLPRWLLQRLISFTKSIHNFTFPMPNLPTKNSKKLSRS